MAYRLRFSQEKNELLRITRDICFEDVIEAMEGDGLLADITHPSEQHAHQRLFVIKINAYAYGVPHVINKEKNELFLKTVYPSRSLTKRYLLRRRKKHE